MKWDQIVEVVETGGFFYRGSVDGNEVNQLLNERGGAGYELVAAVPVGDGNVGTRRILLFFKRPATS